MEHTFFRDCGVEAMMPYLHLMPSEVLVMALHPWHEVTDEQRAKIRAELDGRQRREW